MMNDQDFQDECGDGYRNELQRAHAVSSAQADRGEYSKAAALVTAGRFVVVSKHPIYCKLTDGYIGECLAVETHAATREGAKAALRAMHEGEPDDCDERRFEIWPLALPVAAPVVEDDGDGVPF